MIVSRFDYVFDPATKTITFGEVYRGLRIEQIALITNLTTGTVIYRFDTSTLLGSLKGLDLTLVYDTTAMSSSDHLQIIVDTLAGLQDRTLVKIQKLMEEQLVVSKQILERLEEQ